MKHNDFISVFKSQPKSVKIASGIMGLVTLGTITYSIAKLINIDSERNNETTVYNYEHNISKDDLKKMKKETAENEKKKRKEMAIKAKEIRRLQKQQKKK